MQFDMEALAQPLSSLSRLRSLALDNVFVECATSLRPLASLTGLTRLAMNFNTEWWLHVGKQLEQTQVQGLRWIVARLMTEVGNLECMAQNAD